MNMLDKKMQGKINSITMDVKEFMNEFPPKSEEDRDNILGYFCSMLSEINPDIAIGVMENLGEIGKQHALSIKINYGY